MSSSLSNAGLLIELLGALLSHATGTALLVKSLQITSKSFD